MSPFITAITLASLLVLLQALLSMRASSETRHIYTYLLNDARERAHRSFTVIVPLGRKAETIYPLLDHLCALHYKKLQVIVLVKQTAGSRAIPELRAYRRRNKMLALRIVQYKKNTTPQVLAGRYATGDYIMTMNPGERLNQRFFIAASQILVTTNTEALAVREVVHAARSFKHAFWALTSLTRATRQSLPGASTHAARVIVSRQAMKAGREIQPTSYLSDQFYISLPNDSEAPEPTKTGLASVLVLGALIAAGYVFMTVVSGVLTAGIYGLLFALLPVVTAVIAMMSLKGYTALDYINLVLFIPLSPLYALGQIVSRSSKAIATVSQRQRVSARR